MYVRMHGYRDAWMRMYMDAEMHEYGDAWMQCCVDVCGCTDTEMLQERRGCGNVWTRGHGDVTRRCVEARTCGYIDAEMQRCVDAEM